MSEVDPVILKLMVDANDYQVSLKGSTRIAQQEINTQEQAALRLARTFRTSSDAIGATLRTLSQSIATYLSVGAVVALETRFQDLQATIRATGATGAQLTAVQGQLTDVASRNGVAVGGLADLYGNLSRNSDQLGLSQQQTARLTEGAAAALRIAGASAGESQRGLNAFGTALDGNVVQIGQFNQIGQTMPAILDAAAAGSVRFGGSVAKLRADVQAGTVSTAEFANSVLQALGPLLDQASRSPLTLAGAVNTLGNRLVQFIGEAGEATGATATLAGGIDLLSDHLDLVADALAIIATAMGVGLVVNAVSASTSLFALTAFFGGAATAAEAATVAFEGATTALGGGIGIAITAVVIGLGLFSAAQREAEAATQQNTAAIAAFHAQLQSANQQALTAAVAHNTLTASQRATLTQTAALTNEVGLLTTAYGQMAAAAKTAALETLRTQLVTSRENERVAINNVNGVYARNVDDQVATRPSPIAGRFGPLINRSAYRLGLTSPTQAERNAATQAARGTTEYRNYVQAHSDRQAQEAAYNAERNTPLAQVTVPTFANPNPGRTSGGAGPRARAAPADHSETDAAAVQREIDQQQARFLQELSQTTRNAQERLSLQLQQIEAERAAGVQRISANRDLQGTEHASQRAALIALNDQIADTQRRRIQQQETDRLREEALSLTQQALRDQDSALALQSSLANTTSQRAAIEQRRVDIAATLERGEIVEQLRQAETAGDQAAINAARHRLADLTARTALQHEQTARQNQGLGAAYLQGFRAQDINEQLQQVQVDGLKGLEDGLVGVIDGTKSLASAFHDMASSIIAELARIAIEQAIIQPLAARLFGGSSDSGKSSGGIFGSIIRAASAAFGGGSTPGIGPVQGKASGGYVSAGSLYRINEAASPGNPEGFRPVGSGTIIPLGQMKAATAGGTTIIHAPQFNLRGAVVTEALYAEMQRISGDSAKAAGRAAYGQAMRDAPAAVGRAQRFGTRS